MPGPIAVLGLGAIALSLLANRRRTNAGGASSGPASGTAPSSGSSGASSGPAAPGSREPPRDPSDGPPPYTEHERWIALAVRQGRFDFGGWSTVQCGACELTVSNDVLVIDRGGYRVGVTARLAQSIVDFLGLTLPTPRMSDAIWSAATIRLTPHAQTVSDPSAEKLHSKAIDAQLAGRSGGLISTLGKDWVLCRGLWKTPSRAANYGWHGDGAYVWSSAAATKEQVHVVQGDPAAGYSRAHNYAHWDYSQTFRAIKATCKLRGIERQVSDILMSGDAPELSWEGPVPTQLPVRIPIEAYQ